MEGARDEKRCKQQGEKQQEKGHKHGVRKLSKKEYTLVEGTTSQGIQARGEGPREGGGAGVYKGLAG